MSPKERSFTTDVITAFHRQLYESNVWKTTWLGTPVQKNPLDMWVYQDIIAKTRPTVIIETGTAHGGSAKFFANLMDLIGIEEGKVITVDVNPNTTTMLSRPIHPRITYITGDSSDKSVYDVVKSHIPANSTVMVILDSDHHEDHVAKELALYAGLVSPGCYLVVEDTNVNGHPVCVEHCPGPMEAVNKFLADNDDFAPDAVCERFGATFSPGGWLKRVHVYEQPAAAKESRQIGVSVITLNSGRNPKWLQEARNSFAEQVCSYPIEHVIVDNTMKTFTIAEGYNHGIANSHYKYYLILDDDDELGEDIIQKLIDAIILAQKESNSVYRASCHTVMINADGNSLGNSAMVCQGLFDAEIVESLGGYPNVPWEAYSSALLYHPDTRLGLKAKEKGYTSVIVPWHLMGVRIHRDQASYPMMQDRFESIIRGVPPAAFDNEMSVDISDKQTLENSLNALKYQEMWNWHKMGINADTVTILIITYNSMDVITKCLQSIEEHTPDVSIAFVDNASTDGTPDFLEGRGYAVIRNKENIGYGQAINQGIKEIDTEYIVLMNPDVYVGPRWLENLVACLDRHSDANAGIASCEMSTPGGSIIHEGTTFLPDGTPVNITNLKWPNGIKREFNAQAVCSACWIMRKSVYKSLEFDQVYGLGFYEDVDYCLRARQKGFTVWYTPYASVVHDHHSAWGKILPAMKAQHDKSLNEFLKRWKGDILLVPGQTYLRQVFEEAKNA